MRKQQMMAAALLGMLFLSSCVVTAQEEPYVGSVQIGSAAGGVSASRVVAEEETTESQKKERAAERIVAVFGCDVSEGYDCEIQGDEIIFQQREDAPDRVKDGSEPWKFVTGWSGGGDTPRWLYWMTGDVCTEENTIPEEYAYSAELVDRARECVQTAYDVSAEEADAEGYAYQNRVAVLLRVPDGAKYHVAFAYPSLKLVGIQMFDDEAAAHQFYEVQGARQIEEG